MRRLLVALGFLALTAGCGNAARQAAPAGCIVRVYFCTEITCARAASKAQIRTLSRRLAIDHDVFSVRFVDKREALAIMRKQRPEMTQGLPTNPFPDSLRVRPVDGVASRDIAAKVDRRRYAVHAVKFARDAPCDAST